MYVGHVCNTVSCKQARSGASFYLFRDSTHDPFCRAKFCTDENINRYVRSQSYKASHGNI